MSRGLKEMSMEAGRGSPGTQPQTGMWLACVGRARNKALAQSEFRGDKREKLSRDRDCSVPTRQEE